MRGGRRPPRGGLEGYQIHAIALGLYVWGLTAAAALFVGGPMGARPVPLMLFILFGGGGVGAATAAVAIVLAHRAGLAAQALYAPSGASTPSAPSFSYQQAMAMRGDVAGALTSFEALIAESPGDAAVRLAAAELYAGRGRRPERAAELYREVRRLPCATSTHDFAATNALIDLYRGPLADPARARAELRGLTVRFAGTVPGQLAREALATDRLDSPPSKDS